MKHFILNALQIFGVVIFRFRPVPRVWGIWLLAVNLGCLYFIQHPEAQMLLVTTCIAVVLQTLMHQRMGFTRALGVTHVLWIPMFGWMATRLDTIAAHPDLQLWLVAVCATNIISFVIDMIDMTRFIRGDRAPHYSWA